MRNYFVILLISASSFVFSQSKVDSLQTEFDQTTIDTLKINILHELFNIHKSDNREKAEATLLQSIELSELAKEYTLLVKSYNKYGEFLRTKSSNDSAIAIYEKSVELAENHNVQIGLADAYLGLGYCYLRRGEYDNSLSYLERSLKIAITNKLDLSMANAYSALADVYSQKREYSEAMENYLLSAEKAKEIGNLRSYSITLSNIGMLFIKMENYKNATQYLMESDSLFRILNNENGRAYVIYTLGQINMETGDYEQALTFSQDALAKYEQMGRKNEAGHLHYNIGTIYWRQKQYTNSLASFHKKLLIALEMKDSVSMSSTYKAIGDCYLKLNHLDRAKSNYQHALDIALALDNDMRAMDVYSAFSDVYVYEKNYEKAYENEIAYKTLRNRIHEKNKTDLSTEMEAKYQNEQKAKEISLLSSEKDLQALQLEKRLNERNAIIVFSCLIFVLGGLLYNQYRIKKKANEELKELDRLKSNFFANISHEFRTPLTLIKGSIEHLEQNPDEKLTLDNIKMIRRNTNRILNLVNQLLDLSKIDEGNLHLEPTEIDIYKCLRAATSSFNSLAIQKNIDYRVHIPSSVLWASFDRDKLEKVVYNLLSNAFKFSDDYSTITFEVRKTDQRLRMQVSDSGKGISEDKLPFIFDRFYQVDSGSTRENDGSGIGLSLSKELVELMGGTITATSELNKGSFFTVLWPVQEIKTGQLPEYAPESKVEVSPIKHETYIFEQKDERLMPTILVVEDNVDMRYFIRERLINFYKINEAENGKEALESAIKNPPNLIISDLMMPKMDGIELCKLLKTNLITSHIPIIMLTAKAGKENKIEGLETGADDYLIKPFDTHELLVRVKNLISQRQNLRRIFSDRKVNIDPEKITVTSIDKKFLGQVLTLLEHHYSNPDFGVPQMQKELGMSKTQLHRKLKALTNEAPGELLRNFRLKQAAQFIIQKSDTVTQIAYQVGFNNLSYFAKCFKEMYGVSPSTYTSSTK